MSNPDEPQKDIQDQAVEPQNTEAAEVQPDQAEAFDVKQEVVETPVAAAKSLSFNVGDRIVVNYRIVEGEKHRVQPYEGIVIAKRGAGQSKTFTVRRMGAGNIGVERIFPQFSPNIESVRVVAKGKVRRAKLYYLRGRIGKAATKIAVKA